MRSHLLVIDDDSALVELLQVWLQMNEFEVTTAGTCDEILLSPAIWMGIDCIIIGINQPGMKGLDFTELVHLKGGPPVIVMSGYRPAISSYRTFKAGGAAFLKKPFELEELLELLNVVLLMEARADSVRCPPKT
jgi:two-component system, OmpR family, response regulator